MQDRSKGIPTLYRYHAIIYVYIHTYIHTLQKTNLAQKKKIKSWVMLVLLRFLMVPSILHFVFEAVHGAMLGATFFRVVPC